MLVPVFLSSSWFMLRCSMDGCEFTLRLEPLKAFMDYPVEVLRLEAPAASPARRVSVNGKAVAVGADARMSIPVSFDPGKDRLELAISFNAGPA